MADMAHEKTDEALAKMEKHLSEIYERSQKELEKKTAAFWEAFERKDNKKKKELEAGKITEDDYKKWRQGQLMTGKHWKEMTKTVADEMLNADKTAMAYVNGKLPEIYSLNYNALADQTAGIKGYSFELVNADAVKHLATTDKSLLPFKKVNGENVVRWNTQKVNSEVLQGIIQGESVQKIAKRLENVTGMERSSAIRNARTTVTSAEGKGRLDSYKDAQKQGIILKKRWISTHDHRTRDWHTELDNVEVDIDEPFENHLADGSVDHIMYPGDPDADPSNVYNCRCAMVTEIKGFVSPETGELIEVGQDAEKEQEYETVRSVENCEDFESLKDYMGREYNIDVSDSIRDLDFNGVKSAAGGMEYIINTFPELKGQINKLSVRYEGYMCTDGKTIYYNPKNFSKGKYDGDDLYSFMSGAHEAGHCVDRIICDREALERYGTNRLGYDMFMHNDISMRVVRRGIKEFVSENPEFAAYKAKDVRGLLSAYATESTSETVAEAVGRYAQIKSGKLVYPEKYKNNIGVKGREKFAEKIVELLKGELGR